jgi:hypothetical protein
VDILFALGIEDVGALPRAAALVLDGGNVETARTRIWHLHGRAFDVRAADAGTGETLMAAEDGTPLVRISRSNGQTRLVWSSRFNPEYATVVGDPMFPDLVKRLLVELAPQALVPQDLAVADRAVMGSQRLFWMCLLIALLWLLERWFSERENGLASATD